MGVWCCAGSDRERNRARSLLSTGKPTLVIDAVSLMTLHGLGAADLVPKVFGKPGIVRSVVDLLNQIIVEKQGIESEGLMMLGKEGDTFVRQEITAEQVQAYVKHLESVIKWIEVSCDVLPCEPALRMRRRYKQHLEDLLGVSSVDTMLVASEPGRLLYSDDAGLREVASSRVSRGWCMDPSSFDVLPGNRVTGQGRI